MYIIIIVYHVLKKMMKIFNLKTFLFPLILVSMETVRVVVLQEV